MDHSQEQYTDGLRNEWLGRHVGPVATWTWPPEFGERIRLDAKFIAGLRSQPQTRWQRIVSWMKDFPSLR